MEMGSVPSIMAAFYVTTGNAEETEEAQEAATEDRDEEYCSVQVYHVYYYTSLPLICLT